MLHEAGPDAQTPEALAAHRLIAVVGLSQGNFVVARAHSEKALMIDDSGWDRDVKLRFGHDSRISAFCYLGLSLWTLGELGSARQHIEKAIASAVESGHVPTLVNTYYFAGMLDLFRGDPQAVLRVANPTVEISREHALPLYTAIGVACRGWARARLGEHEDGQAELRQAVRDLADQGNRIWLPLYQGLLAQIESDAQDVESAAGTIDEALAVAEQIGSYWATAFLHRIRGEILLKPDPANPAAAEEAFLSAIAVARQQKARSFELRAALSLAKLYQSIGRAADAHAVLAPALEGFSLTPEFPEIAEAQTLSAALADTEEVKNAAASRQRRLRLQTSYGQAMMWSKGYGAPETRAAFARARDLATKSGSFANRSIANYGHWANSHMRGEFTLARETAEIFVQEAENEGRLPEVSIARRMLGFTCLFSGNFTEARAHLEEALRVYNAGWSTDDKFRLSVEPGLAAMAYLAEANWMLGDVTRAHNLIDESVSRSIAAAHVPTLANSYNVRAEYEVFRGDVEAASRAGRIAFEYSQEHALGHYLPMARIFSGWAHARLGEREPNLSEMRKALAAHLEHGNKAWAPLFLGLIADVEAIVDDADGERARADEAIAMAHQTGEHWTDAFLHRIRGEVLLRRDPANPAPAGDAFLAAIAIAQQQKAKSFELQAALSLVKLYQSTGRPADARAILAFALDGFSPTPQFPEIAEAEALLATLSH
jgi:predicted ATPase